VTIGNIKERTGQCPQKEPAKKKKKRMNMGLDKEKKKRGEGEKSEF
jgi:hypothetical protein